MCLQIDAEICESLLQSGACANAANSIGRTPLHLAASHGLVDCLQLLLSLGGANPSQSDSAGFLPAWHALQHGHVAATMVFVKRNYPITPMTSYVTGFEATAIVSTLFEKKSLHLIKLLVASDCLDATAIFHWLSKQENNAVGQLENQNTIDWLTNFFHTPSSLMHIARKAIRRSIGVRLYSCITSIPLPRPLKDYLFLSDISEDIECMSSTSKQQIR